ncbi:MAB_1171c family putative transporter [Streptomyces goshikiensis]|uniref:MAB_1171c family putative transporter n=1 Tax=Streptomyces goshikiensis TaxID=1942 RepID=UPI0036B8AF8D
MIIALVIGSIWKTVDLTRAPSDRALRILATSLPLLALGEILSLPGVTAGIDSTTTTGIGKLVFNGVYMTGLGALSLFFATSTIGGETAYKRQVWLNGILLAGAVTVQTVCMASTPLALRSHTLGTPDMAQVSIATFYIVGNAYFFYAYLASGLRALRYAPEAGWHLTIGLRAMALGLCLLACSSVNRVILVCARIREPGSYQTLNSVNWSMSQWALGLVLVGMSYSAAIQLARHALSVVRYRRMFHELTPLWSALSATYPELVLKEETGLRRLWSHFRLRGTHARFYRRLIECRDGLVRLSPYLTQVAPHTNLASSPADELAEHLSRALALKPATEDPHTALVASPIALPVGRDLDADAHELIALSHAYARGNHEHGAAHR